MYGNNWANDTDQTPNKRMRRMIEGNSEGKRKFETVEVQNRQWDAILYIHGLRVTYLQMFTKMAIIWLSLEAHQASDQGWCPALPEEQAS